MTTLNPATAPKLRGQEDYFTWQMNLHAIFLILDLTSAITPRSVTPATTSNLTPDPLPCLSILPSSLTTTTTAILSEPEYAALCLLINKKKDWEVERLKLEAEEKRKNETALGWMFLTMEPTLAREVLESCSTKRRADGAVRVAELRELEARGVWEKLRVKYGG